MPKYPFFHNKNRNKETTRVYKITKESTQKTKII